MNTVLIYLKTIQYTVARHTEALEPLWKLSVSSFSLSRRSCWAATDRTWWQEVITELWKCGRRATSNSFTSIQAVTQGSVPWISHMTRGKTDRVPLWQTEEDADRVTFFSLKDYCCGGNWVTSKGAAEITEWSVMGLSYTSDEAQGPGNDWCTATLKK